VGKGGGGGEKAARKLKALKRGPSYRLQGSVRAISVYIMRETYDQPGREGPKKKRHEKYPPGRGIS